MLSLEDLREVERRLRARPGLREEVVAALLAGQVSAAIERRRGCWAAFAEGMRDARVGPDHAVAAADPAPPHLKRKKNEPD